MRIERLNICFQKNLKFKIFNEKMCSKKHISLKMKSCIQYVNMFGKKSNFDHECTAKKSLNLMKAHLILFTSCKVLYLLMDNDVDRL